MKEVSAVNRFMFFVVATTIQQQTILRNVEVTTPIFGHHDAMFAVLGSKH